VGNDVSGEPTGWTTLGRTTHRAADDPEPSKPAWRRALEVLVPVAAFAAIAPFVVNGIASAVNRSEDAAPTSTTATITAPAPTPSPPTTTTTTTTTSTAEPSTTTAATTAASVAAATSDATADDRTIALATEIVGDVSVTTAPVTNSSVAPAATHSHGGVTAEVPLTRDERAELAAQLEVARSAAMQYPTVADALAAGYTKVTGYVPLIGAHYINWSLMDANFDVSKPEMLLYDGTDATSTIVGLSYYLFSDTPPSPFAGPNDHWHQHIGLCIKDGVVVGGEQTTPEQCAARGGTKANVGNGWMVHAWVVPGWESPQGVFSPEHPGLTADLATS
jgi:hypothetical protein